MRIGQLAAQSGVNVQTIRFYERRRILANPARTPSGYRVYSPSDVENVLFIKWCQQLGFTLKEIKQLLQLHSAIAHIPSIKSTRRTRELASILRLAEKKLLSIREKIQMLQKVELQVSSAIQKLQRKPAPVCPASQPTNLSRSQMKKCPQLSQKPS
jgi:MerR family mercuric resistance operon transcriptional regulator